MGNGELLADYGATVRSWLILPIILSLAWAPESQARLPIKLKWTMSKRQVKKRCPDLKETELKGMWTSHRCGGKYLRPPGEDRKMSVTFNKGHRLQHVMFLGMYPGEGRAAIEVTRQYDALRKKFGKADTFEPMDGVRVYIFEDKGTTVRLGNPFQGLDGRWLVSVVYERRKK